MDESSDQDVPFDAQDGLPKSIWFTPAHGDAPPSIAIEAYYLGGKPYVYVWLDQDMPWHQRLEAKWRVHESAVCLWSDGEAQP